MSNKKPSDNPKQKQSPNNNNIPPNTEAFSFLELDNFLSQEITKKDINKKNPKKKPSLEKRDNSDKKQKLRIKPNKSHAREQTKDDMMYVEDDDNQEKKQDSTKLKEKEEIKDNNINTTKNIQKKPEIKNEKFDKRLVKINLEKEKSEIQPKNKKEEEDSKNEIKDKDESKNKKNGIYDIERRIKKNIKRRIKQRKWSFYFSIS